MSSNPCRSTGCAGSWSSWSCTRRQSCCVPRTTRRLDSRATRDQRDDGPEQEDDEQDFGDTGRARVDAAEAEYAGNDRDHKKDCGIVQHEDLPSLMATDSTHSIAVFVTARTTART